MYVTYYVTRIFSSAIVQPVTKMPKWCSDAHDFEYKPAPLYRWQLWICRRLRLADCRDTLVISCCKHCRCLPLTSLVGTESEFDVTFCKKLNFAKAYVLYVYVMYLSRSNHQFNASLFVRICRVSWTEMACGDFHSVFYLQFRLVPLRHVHDMHTITRLLFLYYQYMAPHVSLSVSIVIQRLT